MQQHMDHLKQLKDFDENIAQEKKARALEEQEKMKAKVITTSKNINLLCREWFTSYSMARRSLDNKIYVTITYDLMVSSEVFT